MAMSTLKKQWPLIGAGLVAAGLSYVACRQYKRQNAGACKKSCGGCTKGKASAAAAAAAADDAKSLAPVAAAATAAASAFEYETDNATQSNYRSVALQSFHLEVRADFARKVLGGFVDLRAKALVAGPTQLVLDTRKLVVSRVELLTGPIKQASELKWAMGAEHDVLGVPLVVQLPSAATPAPVGTTYTVRVHYETTPESSAIQWLPKEQTAGKQHPYLFTQCQAIHARSLFPCQDTPAIKTPYTGAVTVPNPLVALMSAVSTTSAAAAAGADAKEPATTYQFEQKVCTPSYLVAIAIGALEKRDISPRCAVWSEKETVEAGAHEFADTEKFLKAAEDICGPYVWGRYDVLLLPPSFPYGGMENPCLTFVTPTLLAGDRSLANVVAHEIAHSWMGNLVTNVTWAHFWLNEGFTVFVERKIMQRLFGKEVRDLHASMGEKALKDDVHRFCSHGHAAFSRLVPPIAKGTDPDDAFSSVPYERGFQLLFYLEKLIGEADMAAYIKHHVRTHQFGHVQTEQFVPEFLAFARSRGVDDQVLAAVDWEAWKFADGMPPVAPTFDRTLIDEAQRMAEAFADGKTDDSVDFKKWSSAQTQVCLERLEDLQSKRFADAETAGGAEGLAKAKAQFRAALSAIDAKYAFTKSQNSEIRFRWITIGVRADWEHVFPAAVKFLTSQGRMKFTRPLYRDLYKSPAGTQLAVDTFQAHASTYHSICAKMVAKDLGLAK